MTTASTPSLGGTNLPVPKEENYSLEYRGGTLQMASGKVVHDLVDTTGRKRFKLRWEYRTATERDTILTAYDGIKNTTATYSDVEGDSYTVTRPENGTAEVTRALTAAGDLKFHIALELVEDS